MIGPQDTRQEVVPLRCLVHAHHHTIALRVVGSGVEFGHSQQQLKYEQLSGRITYVHGVHFSEIVQSVRPHANL